MKMVKHVICGVVLAACGGGKAAPDAAPDAPSRACEDMGGANCFQIPTAPLQTRDGVASALGCGFTPTPAAAAVTFSGKVLTYGTSKPVPSASIALFSSADHATMVGSGTSMADGTYSLEVEAGTTNELFGEFSATGFLDLTTYNVRLDLNAGDFTNFNLQCVTSDNIESAGLLVKEDWDPTVMVVAGTALDCNNVIVEHAAIAVSTTQGQRVFAPRASVYYGVAGAVAIADPPEDRGDTNDNGVFAVFHLQPGPMVYIQMWGFVNAAAMAQGEAGLTLIAEEPIYPVANSAASFNLWTK